MLWGFNAGWFFLGVIFWWFLGIDKGERGGGFGDLFYRVGFFEERSLESLVGGEAFPGAFGKGIYGVAFSGRADRS